MVLAFLCHLYIFAFFQLNYLLSVTKILHYVWHGICDTKEMQRLLFLMKFWWIAVPRLITPLNLFHLCVALNLQKLLSSCFCKTFFLFFPCHSPPWISTGVLFMIENHLHMVRSINKGKIQLFIKKTKPKKNPKTCIFWNRFTENSLAVSKWVLFFVLFFRIMNYRLLPTVRD